MVPVYNVEPYLATCLDSALSQSFGDLELVLVDDGSTDGSAAIAADYAARDPRVRVIRQPNAGLGAARNVGVEVAVGEYLAFLDSDDLLPPDAYATMMRTIEASGSDFVVGKLVRDLDGRRQVMRLMRENHRASRVAVTLDEMPLMLADVFAVNKVFRRSFWDEASLEFPVGVRYEDQPTLTKAFLAAKTFDVLAETVYLWRIRGDGSSITQRRHDIDDLRDRVLTKRTSTEAVLEKAPQLRDLWLGEIMPVDMWEYCRAAVPHCAPEYWALLREGFAELWRADTVPFDRTRLPVQQRMMGWLVEEDRHDDLVRLVEFLDAHGGDIPVEVRGDHVAALLPGVDSAHIPETVYVLGEHELSWEGRLTSARWHDDEDRPPHLRLTGFGLIRNAPPDESSTTLTGQLVGPGGDVDLDLRPMREPRATSFVGRPSQNHDLCGFEVEVDVADLPLEPTGTSTWRFELLRTVEGVRAGGPLQRLSHAELDTTWHRLSAGPAEARLRMRHGELVLEVRGGRHH